MNLATETVQMTLILLISHPHYGSIYCNWVNMPAYFQVTQLKIFRKVYMIFHKEASTSLSILLSIPGDCDCSSSSGSVGLLENRIY